MVMSLQKVRIESCKSEVNHVLRTLLAVKNFNFIIEKKFEDKYLSYTNKYIGNKIKRLFLEGNTYLNHLSGFLSKIKKSKNCMKFYLKGVLYLGYKIDKHVEETT